MLPIKLDVKNFLAYHHPDPINLEALHLACLSGENGAGKSSLLDAITWALWGKARTRSDDDLVYLGQDEMQVTLDFLQDEHKYRVIRRRKIGKRRKSGGRTAGTSTLDFFGWDDESNAFTLISEPSIRETQARINALLRMDYDLFTSSAFLKQGRADAFTTKTPAERKNILSDILGLERWSLYEQEARQILIELDKALAAKAHELQMIEREISQEPALVQQLDLAEADVADAEAKVSDAEALFDEVRGADIELSTAEKEFDRIQRQIAERETDIKNTQAQIVKYQAQIAHYQDTLDNAEQIRAGVAELESARAESEELSQKLTELTDINEAIYALEKQLDDARQEIELEIRTAQATIESDSAIVAAAEEAVAALEEIEANIAELESLEASREGWQTEIAELNETRATLTSENKALRVEMADIKQRLDILEESSEALCPVCGQPLNEEQKANLIEEMQNDGTERGNLFRDKKTEIEEIGERVAALKDEIKAADRQLAGLPRLRNERGGYAQQVQAATEANGRIERNETRATELQTTLAEERYAEALREALAEHKGQRDGLDYNRDEHDAVRQKLNTFVEYQAQAQTLEAALEAVPLIQDSLNKADESLKRYEEHLSNYAEEATAAEEAIKHLEVKHAEMERRKKEVNAQRTKLQQERGKLVVVQQSLKAITDLRNRLPDVQDEIADLRDQQAVYEQLKVAFGKNGIPAMIIDAAIPELEDAANRLLNRMTSNRMHLRFDTQREKKTGGVAETLDIWIQDELGQRDYSLFSGGEAFRINFAIRVALSQMLARRAGAQLRTLFIDEGFGTQDQQGRERLVEAITTIQDDFDLILVITHIEELKDAFPARVEVVKTANGSFATIR